MLNSTQPSKSKKFLEMNRFLERVESFQPKHDGGDLFWRFFLKSGRKWQYITVQKYDETFFIHCEGRNAIEYPGQELNEEEKCLIRKWHEGLGRWQEATTHDPLQAQADLLKRLPLTLRMGLITRKNLTHLLPSWMRIDQELKTPEKKCLVPLLSQSDPEPLPEMTLELYMEYCRLAYNANPATFEERLFGEKETFERGLSGLAYYKRYADGRHGGLLEIDPKSPEAFSNWYHSNVWQGGHPWEIYRGGNSTHISLSVSKGRYKPGWEVILSAFSSTRLVEACRIALALDSAGLKINIADKKSYLKRIRAEDWVGILPDTCGIKYGWHLFPEKYAVADCIHLEWILEENKSRRSVRTQLKTLASWLPEDITAFPVEK